MAEARGHLLLLRCYQGQGDPPGQLWGDPAHWEALMGRVVHRRPRGAAGVKRICNFRQREREREREREKERGEVGRE